MNGPNWKEVADIIGGLGKVVPTLAAVIVGTWTLVKTSRAVRIVAIIIATIGVLVAFYWLGWLKWLSIGVPMWFALAGTTAGTLLGVGGMSLRARRIASKIKEPQPEPVPERAPTIKTEFAYEGGIWRINNGKFVNPPRCQKCHLEMFQSTKSINYVQYEIWKCTQCEHTITWKAGKTLDLNAEVGRQARAAFHRELAEFNERKEAEQKLLEAKSASADLVKKAR